MNAYFTKDREQRGGFYDIFVDPPLQPIRKSVEEVRFGTIDDTVFAQIMDGTIPMDPVTFFDTTLEPLYNAATTYWTPEGGYV